MATRLGQGRWWPRSASTLGLLLCAPVLAADCKLQTFEIPVRTVGMRPVVTVGLNGTDFPLLLDTGAFYSFITEATAAQLKLPLSNLRGLQVQGHTGAVEVQGTRVARVVLNGAAFSNLDFIVGGNELGHGIAGILGRNVLSFTDTEYDLANGVMRLVFPKGDCRDTNLAHWAGKAPVVVVPLVSGSGDDSISVDVRINGRRLEALMDTGAPGSSLKKSEALKAGIAEADLVEAGRAGGAGKGSVAAWRTTVETFELGGEKATRNHLFVHDTGRRAHDMLLGVDYFLSHRIYVSRLQRKLYLTWNGSPIFRGDSSDSAGRDLYAAAPAEVAADDADGLARRGQAAAARGDFARALQDLDRACALAPQSTAYLVARARIHQALRNAAAALQDLDRSLQLDFELHEARLLRVPLRAAKGDRTGALADLDLLDGALPPTSGLRADLAGHYVRMDQVPQALRQWDLWMPSHLNDRRRVEVLNDRCWLRTRLKLDLAAALEDCKASVALEGENALSRDSLGWTWLRLGEAARAIASFDKAIALKADQAISHYGRGLAHALAGKAEDAARDLAAARRLEPGIDDRVVKTGFEAAPKP